MSNERYELKTGPNGFYFHDNEAKNDMTMEGVVEELNAHQALRLEHALLQAEYKTLEEKLVNLDPEDNWR